MAVRDRNLFAWQAYVIVATFFSVILLGTTFFGWMSASTYSKQLEDLKKTSADASNESRKQAARINRLKSMLGVGEFTSQELEQMASDMANDPELGDIEKLFAEQMKLFAKTDKEKNLLMLPKLLMDTVRIRNAEVEAARKREAEILKEQSDILARETAKANDAIAKMDKAQKDLESERASHATQVATLNTEKEEITKKYEDNQKLFDTQLAAKKAEIAALQTKTKEQFERIARLQEEVNSFNPDDFQTPQGEITKVVEGGNVIWLNLGSADGLQEGVIFKVFDASNATLKKPDYDRSRYSREEWEKLPLENRLVKGADPKATVQIIQVIDSHSARAKVLDSNNRSRPATRDLIYSPGWRAGRKAGFVLAGFDDKEQEEKVKRLIINNRGEVHDKIRPNTNYLVLGTTRVYENPSPAETEKNKQLSARLKEAKENTINIMQVDTLLSWLEPKNGERISPLTTSGEDFKKRSPK